MGVTSHLPSSHLFPICLGAGVELENMKTMNEIKGDTMPQPTNPDYKPIRFRRIYWNEIKAFADELAIERGVDKQDLPKVVMEAIKFYKENRNKEL